MSRMPGLRLVWRGVLALVWCAALKPSSLQSQESGGVPQVEFDHADCDKGTGECRRAFDRTIKDQEKFEIIVKNTQPDLFEYDVAGVSAEPTTTSVANAVATKTLEQVHDRRYGGYLVRIRRKSGSTQTDLPDATLVISVRTPQWTLGFGGGFPVSTLTDKKFALTTPAGSGATQYKVTRESNKEDDVALSTATFMHISHTKTLAGWGVSFGVGVGGGTAYFTGVSKLFGDVGAFTLGPVFGSRQELPSGVKEHDSTTDANLLAKLSNRNAVGLFAAFSFTFLGNDRTALQKPFKGEP